MYESKVDETLVDEEVWSAWVQKGKRLDRAGVRKGNVAGGVVLVLIALALVIYFLFLRQANPALA
ncbi:MAG: hypothetical protein H7039_00630 [Bryobacteraceae bacterium]|nr:hypothetical protein [Bryobacteraceae bacterium]